MRILLTGSSGFIGCYLLSYLRKKGNEVVCLERFNTSFSHEKKPGVIYWDPEEGKFSKGDFEGFDVVIHLAGESIVGRWTEKKKQRIDKSRVGGTRLLSQILSQVDKFPKVIICASAMGFYGTRGDEKLTEDKKEGDLFLSRVAKQWEKAALEGKDKMRVVSLRLGMVLDRKGGALAKLLPLFRFGLGMRIASGKQWVSWVVLEELARIILFIIGCEKLSGAVNICSPGSVLQREFAEKLARALHRPLWLRLPKFLVSIFFGQMGEETLLASQRGVPQKLIEQGYEFIYPDIEKAFKEVLEELS